MVRNGRRLWTNLNLVNVHLTEVQLIGELLLDGCCLGFGGVVGTAGGGRHAGPGGVKVGLRTKVGLRVVQLLF